MKFNLTKQEQFLLCSYASFIFSWLLMCYYYKIFCNGISRADLRYKLSKDDIYKMELQQFLNKFIKALGIHAPMGNKYIRANQNTFMNKNLRKKS